MKKVEFDDLLPKCSINEIIYDYEKWNRLKNEATKKKNTNELQDIEIERR